MQTETAMASALKAAGFVTSNERLRDIAVEAWARWSKPLQSSDRMAFVRERLHGEITWHMMEQFAPLALRDAINALMRDTAELIAAQRKRNRSDSDVVPGGGGHSGYETHSGNAPTTKAIPLAQTGGRSGLAGIGSETRTYAPSAPNSSDRGVGNDAPGGGHSPGDTQSAIAPADHLVPVVHHLRRKPGYGPTLKEMADRQAAAGAARLATTTRLSKLDTFMVNNQKIGDLTAAEAVAWAGSRERDARFVRLLTANLPPDRPIREFVSADEADKIYASAEQIAA